MNMYSLMKQGNTSKEQIEDSFGGNICRCTGYRPILKAFRSLTVDDDLIDVEELDAMKKVMDPLRYSKCGRTENRCVQFLTTQRKWIKVYTLTDLLNTLRLYVNAEYMLVAGNTAKGVYPMEPLPDVYIDVTSVPELLQQTVTVTNIALGANVTLTNTISFLRSTAMSYKQFEYLGKVADHISLVANIPVRNVSIVFRSGLKFVFMIVLVRYYCW